MEETDGQIRRAPDVLPARRQAAGSWRQEVQIELLDNGERDEGRWREGCETAFSKQ